MKFSGYTVGWVAKAKVDEALEDQEADLEEQLHASEQLSAQVA